MIDVDTELEMLTNRYKVCFENRFSYFDFASIYNSYTMLRNVLMRSDLEYYMEVKQRVAEMYPDAFDELFQEQGSLV